MSIIDVRKLAEQAAQARCEPIMFKLAEQLAGVALNDALSSVSSLTIATAAALVDASRRGLTLEDEQQVRTFVRAVAVQLMRVADAGDIPLTAPLDKAKQIITSGG